MTSSIKMEFWSDNSPAGRSPRKELQGPRPTPLKINKESHKIKKPPLPQQPPSQAAPPRQPVIIYTVPPKVIHTTPGGFMNLVQSLTGGDSYSSSSMSNASSSHTDAIVIRDSPNNDMRSSTTTSTTARTVAISPAARHASIEKAARSASHHRRRHQHQQPEGFSASEMGIVGEIIEIGQGVLKRPAGMIQSSILSPGRASLSRIPSSFFFLPSSDPSSSFSFLHDLMSPVLIQGNKQYFAEGSFMPSPSNFASPLLMNSPTPPIDLFNNFMN